MPKTGSQTAVSPTNGEIVSPARYDSFRAYVQARAERQGANLNGGSTLAEEVMSAQVEAILAATEDENVTAEDIWNADMGGTIAGQHMQDVPLRLHSMLLVPANGAFSAPLGAYAILNATITGENPKGLPIGTEVKINNGSPLIIAKVRAFESQSDNPENLELDCVIKGYATQSGNTVLKLVSHGRTALIAHAG